MSINITSTPQAVMPVYNPIYLTVSSNKTAEEAFAYVFDLYINGSYVTRNRLLPRPNTSDAIYSPARVLESYLSHDKSHNYINYSANTNCVLDYEVVCGEEYRTAWDFSTVSRDTVSGTTYTLLSSDTNIHAYVAGDSITIEGTYDATFDGVFEVYSVINNKSVLLTADFLSAANIIPNPRFINTSAWNLNAIWVISGGTANIVNSNLLALEQLNIVESGTTYEIQMNVVSLSSNVKTYLGVSSNHTVTTSGTSIFQLTASDTFVDLQVPSSGNAVIESFYIYPVGQFSGSTNYTDNRATVFTGATEVLENPSMAGSAGNGWTTNSYPTCSSVLGLNGSGQLVLTIPDSTCEIEFYSTATTISNLVPGTDYLVTFNVSNVNNPSGDGQAVYANVGGTYGEGFVGTGTCSQVITCGNDNKFFLKFFMDADTGGFGSHSTTVESCTLQAVNSWTGYSFNGVVQYEDVPAWQYTHYSLNDRQPALFLTNQPVTVKTKLVDRGSIGFFNIQMENLTGTPKYSMICITERFDGSPTIPIPFVLSGMSSTTTTHKIFEFGAYPWNLNFAAQMQYGIDVIDTDTKSYQLVIFMEEDPILDPLNYIQVSEYKTFEIDTTCSKFEDVRFMFLNPHGQFDFFTANLLSRKTLSVGRTSFQKVLPKRYELGDRGKTVISIDAQESFTVTCNWINEETYAWLMDLFQSTEVYILNNSTGELDPIVIDNTSIEEKKRVNDHLLNITFSYSKAYNRNTARN